MVGRAAVLGSPIGHSRSPDLHLAAYRALGLDWTYERIECPAGALAGIVDGLPDEYVGLSVTMPGKAEALAYAVEKTDRAVLVGSANTLVRIDGGWRADCTDVDGVRGALADAGVVSLRGSAAVVIGAGGTARPALLALAELGMGSVSIVARSVERARSAIELAERFGVTVRYVPFDAAALVDVCGGAAVAVSTAPADAVAALTDSIAQTPVVLDAIYNPWPTPLATAVLASGGTVVSGLDMLLNQAFGQVEQFTGRPAPKREMAAALGR